MKQRDNRWRQLRRGDVTASRFGDVLARPAASGVFTIHGKRGEYHIARDGDILTGEPLTGRMTTKAAAEERRREFVAQWQKTHWSESAEDYLDEKVVELTRQVSGDVWKSDATDWGIINEPLAFEAAIPVVQARFKETLSLPVDDFAYLHHPTEPHIGCSPDGIIGDDGLCEIKCPYNPKKWMRAYRKGLTLPSENRAQVQGQLWVTGRKWCFFCYFDPGVIASGIDPLLSVTVERDEEYIDQVLAPRVTAFRDYLYAECDRLIEKEVF